MSEIGFGIMGCGVAGRIHAEAIKATRQGKVIAAYDVEEKKMREFLERYPVKGYTDLKRFLSREDIQIVSICAPSGLHSYLGIEAARAGKHLVVEKPLEINSQRCDALIDAARSNRRKLTVVYPSRFKPAVKAIRSAFEKKRFGRLILGNALVRWYRSPEYYESSEWRGKKELSGGGTLMTQSIHTIDLLQWMMGPVKAVQSKVRTLVHNIEVEDTALAIIEFESGALGLIEGTTSVYPGFDGRLEIFGEDGSVCMEGDRMSSWLFREPLEEDEKIGLVGRGEVTGGSQYAMDMSAKYHRKQIEDMIHAVLSDCEPLVSGEEGKKTVEIICQIYSVSQ